MRSTKWMVVGMVIVLLPNAAAAQRGRADVRAGNRLYTEGRFDEAHEKYLDALRDDPDSPIIHFNVANSLYRTEEFARALEAYRQALEANDPSLQAKAWYNLGNALYRQQQLQQSLEAYKQALRLDPNDVDAKHNLELLLKQMQQQQQQQQQQREDDQQQSDSEQQQQDDQRGGQDQPQPQDRQQGQNRNEGEQPPDRQTQQGQRPQQMSRDEAERLLRAIKENPGEIQRRRAQAQPRRPVKKKW
jgi:Ca-activated chloride channel family protein